MSSIVVWDAEGGPAAPTHETLLWRSYGAEQGAVSVPAYLEAHADRLRARYLAFVHDLGEHRVGGARVIDRLELDDGFSFWWMTLIAEKSPFKSPRIYDCLRLLALEEIVLDRRAAALTLISADRALARAMRELCDAFEMSFRWRRAAAGRASLTRRLYDALPQPIKGLLSFRHIAMRWALRRARRVQWFEGGDAIFFCSYFIHLDRELCSSGRFHSRHWEDLPRSLQEHGKRANWLHLFLRSTVVPCSATGLDWVARFNEKAAANGRHTFVDSYVSWTVVLRVFKRWLRLVVLAARLRGVRAAFTPRGSRVSFWPLLHKDWHASLSGAIGVDGCLYLELFDAALRDLPRQDLGLYLFENHAWEKALLRSWRSHGHGRIIGVQHATVPFWYLPYFEDRRSLAASSALPLPDCIAVNGPAPRDALARSGWPADLLCDVEALRYLGIASSGARDAADPPRRAAVRVLVLGDISPASMGPFLALVDAAAKLLPPDFELTLKPHPGYQPDLSAYPALASRQTQRSLAEILPEHDVAVAANNTSAAIDAYLAGLPVTIALSGDGFNLSPLRGQGGVSFVGTPQQLAAAMRDAASQGTARREPQRLFFAGRDLLRWKSLLGYASQVA